VDALRAHATCGQSPASSGSRSLASCRLSFAHALKRAGRNRPAGQMRTHTDSTDCEPVGRNNNTYRTSPNIILMPNGRVGNRRSSRYGNALWTSPEFSKGRCQKAPTRARALQLDAQIVSDFADDTAPEQQHAGDEDHTLDHR